jgi:hypothetical protein
MASIVFKLHQCTPIVILMMIMSSNIEYHVAATINDVKVYLGGWLPWIVAGT